jgi:hypothetical protein
MCKRQAIVRALAKNHSLCLSGRLKFDVRKSETLEDKNTKLGEINYVCQETKRAPNFMAIKY